MKLKISVLLLLCVAVFGNGTATAQEFDIFAKQKVVVADIRDINDRHLSDGVKQCIRQGIIDACTKSSDYEVYEINIEDVKRQLTASGQKVSFSAICNAIGKRADYIIFTNVKLSSSEVGAQNITIYITSSLYRIATGSEMKTRFAEAAPTSSSILSATSKLVSELLGIRAETQPNPQQVSHRQPAYSQFVQPVEKIYKIGDYYDNNNRQGVVFAVTPDGKHGKIISLTQSKLSWESSETWCSNLGVGWRLPTKEELSIIYRNIDTLNKTLITMGIEITKWYWSSNSEKDKWAWIVFMSNGNACEMPKYDSHYVRAVCTF